MVLDDFPWHVMMRMAGGESNKEKKKVSALGVECNFWCMVQVLETKLTGN